MTPCILDKDSWSTRLEMAQVDGYLTIDKTARQNKLRHYEDWLRRTYMSICRERKLPFVLVGCRANSCEITLDFDSVDRRGPHGELLPLPPAANAEVDALLSGPGYRRLCWGSAVIKKVGGVPHHRTHELAQRVFRLALAAARTPVAPGEWE